MGHSSSASSGAKGQPPESKAGVSRQLLDRYKLGERVGSGAYSVVYFCQDRRSGEEVAVKLVDKMNSTREDVQREADILRSCNHPNIVRCHGLHSDRRFFCLVMDAYVGGDLMEAAARFTEADGRADCRRMAPIAAQATAAVHYLHGRCIVHRDIKGDNFLVDQLSFGEGAESNCHVVLADFGTACHLQPGERLKADVGTPAYWAPELHAKSYGPKVDVWALGVTFYSFLTGCFPFSCECDVWSREPEYTAIMTLDCKQVLQCMLLKDEQQRCCAGDVAESPWLVLGSELQEEVSHASDTSAVKPGKEEGCSGDAARGVMVWQAELSECSTSCSFAHRGGGLSSAFASSASLISNDRS